MWIMSDRTLPRSLRMIEGFGVHSFRLVNDAGESTFVKFHWRPKIGLQSTIWDETVKIAGADPDFHRRDMFEAIAAGKLTNKPTSPRRWSLSSPKWTMCTCARPWSVTCGISMQTLPAG